MTGSILQINISPGGIPKQRVGQAQLSPVGIADDAWRNLKYHGGPNQALLLIGQETLDELSSLGYPVFSGALGENLTTTGLDYSQMRAGQRWQLGSQCLIELSKLREPCRTLDVYNLPGLARIQPLLKKDARGGWYARVLEGGLLFPGDALRLVDALA
jgi:MOSC domain-containing protein YiiM